MRLRCSQVVGFLGLVFAASSVGCRENPVKKKIIEVAMAQAGLDASSPQALASAVAQAQTSVTGKVHSEGGDLGNWDITLGECASKQDMFRVLCSDECKVLEGHIEKTNFKTWTPKGDIRHVSGHLKFDCTHSGGKGHVSGEATFSHCH